MTLQASLSSRTIRYLHLDAHGRFILLGYYLELTHREYEILKFIFDSYPSPRRRDEIAETIDGLSPNGVAVFVNLINRKSRAIGGRRLILCQRGAGYYLNEYM